MRGLEANERIVDGGPWTDDPSMTQVSIEESIRERFDIDLGDVIRFEVLGRTIRARVVSVREVQWNDTRRGGFMFVFRPDAFEDAPHSFIAMFRGPEAMAERGRLQRDLVTLYSNVSIIDVRDVMSAAREILDAVTLAISVVGAITVFTGMLILIGSVAMTKFQRLYEAAIFKTLGANSRTIATMTLLEYGGLGTLAGIVRVSRRRPADLGAQPLLARNRVASGVRSEPWRHRPHGRGRRRRRRAVESRRSPTPSAGHVTRRVTRPRS